MTRSTRGDLDEDGTLFEEGIDQFNRGEFWIAHESWERIWLATEGKRRRFLQGLIQIAAACYHLERRNQRGALRLLVAAIEKLDGFDAAECEIELQELRNGVRTLLESLRRQGDASGEATFGALKIRRHS